MNGDLMNQEELAAILSREEYNKVVFEWSGESKEPGHNQSVIDLFRKQASVTPNSIAIVYGERKLTYRNLDELSDRLAYYLKQTHNIQTGDFVGILLNRSDNMIIAMMGVLKCGAAYVSIDAEYPDERKQFIIDDAGVNVLITETEFIFDVQFFTGGLFAIDVELSTLEESPRLAPRISPNALAYLIYTSGTTGKPKGVMISHEAIVSLVHSDYIQLAPTDVFAFFSAPVFDATTFEVYTPLLNGLSLVIPTDIKKLFSNVDLLNEFLKSNHITVLWLTKTLFENLFSLKETLFNSLNYLIIGGEALDKAVVNRVLASSFKPRKFLNGYGPTESTTFTCVYEMNGKITSGNVPIGKPIKNRKIYILNSQLQPVKIGIVGELFVGGNGLAKGYLNNPDLTAEKFVNNPFSDDLDLSGTSVLYKTGDYARWLPDGNIEFIGRKDGQVKIRGYRIELDEIEHALRSIPAIKQACVIVKEKDVDGIKNKFLVGYYVPNEIDLKHEDIIRDLSATLPSYMVPQVFVGLPNMPVTLNGKLDKAALPDVDTNELIEYSAPRSDIEQIACEIWKEVLNLDRVGINDEFFRIGGNSILAMQVAHKMSRALNIDVTVTDIFKYKFVADLLANTAERQPVKIPKIDHSTLPSLSFSQERLWFIEQLEGGTHAYHIPELYEIDSNVSLSYLAYSINKVVERHEVLRSTIRQEDDEKVPIQVVHSEPLTIPEYQLRDTSDWFEEIKKEIRRPFLLTKEYPIRVCLYQIYSGNHISKTLLLVNTHHIASDRWSMGVFMAELLDFYEAYANHSKLPLSPLEIQYKDYAVWQKAHLTEDILNKQIQYWKAKLDGYQLLNLPTDFARPSLPDYNGGSIPFKLSDKTADFIRNVAKRKGVTVHTVITAGLAVLLGKYSDQDDIVIGSPIANRQYRQTEGLIGFFANTQVCRILLDTVKTFDELVGQVHESQVEAQQNQDLPFDRLVKEIEIDRDLSRHPIFQVMLVTQSISQLDFLKRQEQYFRLLDSKDYYEVERFDMTVFVDEIGNDLTGSFSYATSLFKQDTIKRLSLHFESMFEKLSTDPNSEIQGLNILTKEENAEVLHKWSGIDKSFDDKKTVIQLFEEQVKIAGTHTALVYDETTFTYEALNARSNEVAHAIKRLIQKKTEKDFDTPIGIYFNRSPNLIIAILAVLKAGAAYVPLDPAHPTTRVHHILQDTNVTLILTDDETYGSDNNQLPIDKIVSIDNLPPANLQDIHNLNGQYSSLDLAYILYTSGSTGKPKGVMIENRSVVNYILNVGELIMKNVRNVDFSSNITFDLTITTTLCALSFGKKIFIYKGDLLDFDSYANHLVRNKIDFVKNTPSVLANLPSEKFNNYKIKTAFIGGEKLEGWQFSKISKIISDCYDEYGPTEATVGTTVILKTEDRPLDGIIGTPYPNCKVYVCDRHGSPVPVGVPGELYIGGLCLSRGYLNLPDLTASRFILKAFFHGKNERLYKTGDLVKWTPDGNLEYIGRNDSQVKIRGFRIELNDIEANLAVIEGVQEACVLVKERTLQNKVVRQLVAYCVLENKGILNESRIQQALALKLPRYMIPDFIIMVDKLPITLNGKVDRNALAKRDIKTDDIQPSKRNDLETALLDAYSEVLEIPKNEININESFFKLGGSSLLTIYLKNRLHQIKEFGNITVADLFKYNSIRKLAESRISAEEYSTQNAKGKSTKTDIAIIGMSGAFSGAQDISQLWQMISDKTVGTRLYTKEECIEFGIDQDRLNSPNYVPAAGLVDSTDYFDPAFWGLSPSEAKQIDPQIRKFVEHCWLTLESAGYVKSRKQKNIGVFAGSGYSYYYAENILTGELSGEINLWEAYNSNSKDALATKAAFLLGLTGPANSINTACSTGLVSVIEACQKLELGICDLALAGGVSLIPNDKIGHIYQEGMILSKDGYCRTFDSEASGTVGGSGVGVVLLKRLEDAIGDKDNIIAVIKGYSLNNDGDRKTSFTAPSVIGQAECIINAQRHAGIFSNDVDYVECHGTGTNLGDPIEVLALKDAFQFNRDHARELKDKVTLGSIKANIGHTDSAAGTAGLIKCCLMLQNNLIPGQANFTTANEELRLDESPFRVSAEGREWTGAGTARIAGVSSFGIGGTNAHLILSEYVSTSKIANGIESSINSTQPDPYIICLSAKSKHSLQLYQNDLLNYITGKGSKEYPCLKNITYTLQEKREHFNYRSSYTVSDISTLALKLRDDLTFDVVLNEKAKNIVFMFPGQGVQYRQMCWELYNTVHFFQQTVDACINEANKYLTADLFKIIFSTDESHHNINDIEWSAISLFVIEYSLARYFEYLGVVATAYIGHSFGEYVAATLAGVFSLADAIKIVVTRGRIMQAAKPGAMLSINCNPSLIETEIAKHNCDLAVVNSADDVVLSGTTNAIHTIQKYLTAQNIPIMPINGTVAGHSRLMDEAAKQFERELTGISFSKPTKVLVSNLTGQIADENVAKPEYWSNQLRNTVQFSEGVRTLTEYFNHQVTFVELAPGKGLSYFINKLAKAKGYKSIQTLSIFPSQRDVMNDAASKVISSEGDVLARLWMAGLISKPNELNRFESVKTDFNLPSYRFNFQKCWIQKRKIQSTLSPVDDMFHKRVWDRREVLADDGTAGKIEYTNILILINPASQPEKCLGVLESLKKNYSGSNFITHLGANNINSKRFFDFNQVSDIYEILNESSRLVSPDLVIYISGGTDIENPCIDLMAVRSIFDWQKQSGYKIQKFASISIENYDVIGTEKIDLKPSIIFGVTQSIPCEYFSTGIKIIHLDLAANNQSYKQIPIILARDHKETFFAIRGSHFWTPVYTKIELENNFKATPEPSIARECHIVTGGLGGVGYTFAHNLASKNKNSFIFLFGRTEESMLRNDYRGRLQKLRSLHPNITYLNLDIGSKNALPKIKRALETLGVTSIKTILHSAGVGAKSALNEKTIDDLRPVVNPKICGVMNLFELSNDFPVENLFCCSSISSIVPTIGNMEYTAANLFLDEIAYRKVPSIKHILTVNLNQVSDTGMLLDFLEQLTAKHGPSSNSITSQDFPNIIELLQRNKLYGNIIFSRVDLNSVIESSRSNMTFEKEALLPANKIHVTDSSGETREQQVAYIFGELLGLEQISVFDDFFKLGGNSILAIKVAHRLSDALKLEVRIADIFKYKTSHNLSELFVKPEESSNKVLEKWTI